jgi:hypothetical protein
VASIAPDAAQASQRSVMHFLSKHIDSLLLTDWQTLVLLGLICALASYFIKDYLANPPFVIFLYPFLVLFSVLCQYLFLQFDLFSPKKLDQWLTWTVVGSICGTAIGMGLIAFVAMVRDRSNSRA